MITLEIWGGGEGMRMQKILGGGMKSTKSWGGGV